MSGVRTPWVRLVGVLVGVVALVSGCGVAPPASQLLMVDVPDSAPLAYCATAPVEALPATVTRVVVAVHGLDADACAWRATVEAALGGDNPGTAVVAPQFGPRRAPYGALRWTNRAWPAGDPAIGGGASSFAALDALIAAAGDREVVVVGFSAGGQLANRHAATSPVGATRYVVMNPSSYVYFTPERPEVPPEALAACPTYDDWRYGLRGLNAYAAAAGPEAIAARYRERRVTYLIGTRDDSTSTPMLDNSCAARAQGPDREARAHRYQQHLRDVFGAGVTARHPLIAVAGVGHDGAAMVRSDAARAVLLDA